MNRKQIISFTCFAGLFIVGIAHSAGVFEDRSDSVLRSPQFSQQDNKFRNPIETNQFSFGKTWQIIKAYVASREVEKVPETAPPLQPLAVDDFHEDQRGELRFARLGHSTILLRLGDKNWLFDPMFSDRASPVQWAGPQRFHEVPVDINQLPPIEGVIISHNHYDHLDYGTVQQLKDKVNHFLAPLGIGKKLQEWGVSPDNITEMDWWDKKQIGNVEIIATPSQHFSGRGLFDADETLWSSWVLRNQEHSVFFSGDSGYFDGFREIGERYGPFDYAFMECGAYNTLWPDVHMMPEETLQAFKDLQGRALVPIHNGTFNLSIHPWYEPMERIASLAAADNIDVLFPLMGETVTHQQLPADEQTTWWAKLRSQIRQNQ